jgi:glycosyltransferase involved in cell wall biosynthesis
MVILPVLPDGGVSVASALKSPIETRRPEAKEAESRDRPRVLHFLPFAVRGGAEEHALSLLSALANSGFEPWIAAPPALLADLAQELKAFGVQTFSITHASLFAFAEVSRFARFLRRQRIAIVHSHMFPASIFASPLARVCGVRGVVETFHLREVWREDKPLKGSFWLDRQISRFVDRYIAVSHAAERHLSDTKGIPRSKVTTIHNGRDLTRFHPPFPGERAHARAELGVSNKQTLLVLGRLEPQKGHIYVIETIRGLVRAWPRLIALFAGAGALRTELNARCQALGLAEQVRFLGQRSDPERLLAAADIVVLPSLYEGLPLVAIEALATARPMVATDIEGTREIVIHGETGLLVPPADSAALAQAVERLLESPPLGAQLGARGRALVERNFDVRRQVEQTVQVYEELLARPTGRNYIG